ncbi:uncharacterized protein LOC121053292 isoform X2 [Oryza brachyantha]|uniref:uncharacterized protein LOC121053292 isoform X2 n=1 Tax=Oryza brachyantha TaxID=4533 RepID=UPI001ADC379D|nr:uncharacterized protein LOC121053292 isoform X2 [Oryza brachyantha]
MPQGAKRAMTLMSWNCRGVGGHLGSKKMLYLQWLIRSTCAQVIFLSETHNVSISSDEISHAFSMDDSFVVPAQHTTGGLWLMWTNEMKLTIVSYSLNYILAFGVHQPSGLMFNLLCIYDDPTHQSTSRIWRKARNFVVNSSHRPTFSMGDLNDIMYENEKFGPTTANNARISLFRHHVRELGLLDLGYRGPTYTWSNKRKGKNLIMQRLDRSMGNVEWCHNFPNTAVYHLPLIYSDHAPILAILNPANHRHRYSFKFENWWLQETDFQVTAQEAWLQAANALDASFHSKIRQLSRGLQRWQRKKKPLTKQLAATESKLLASSCADTGDPLNRKSGRSLNP